MKQDQLQNTPNTTTTQTTTREQKETIHITIKKN